MIVFNSMGRISRPLMVLVAIIALVAIVFGIAFVLPAWIARTVLKNLLGDGKLLFAGLLLLVGACVWWLVVTDQAGEPTRWPTYWLVVAALALMFRPRKLSFGPKPPDQPADPKIIEI